MNCDCEHQPGCGRAKKFIDPIRSITEPMFPGPHPAFKDFEEIIKKRCRYRKPKEIKPEDIMQATDKTMRNMGGKDVKSI